jgi:quercetin 2,3-dioxygenase
LLKKGGPTPIKLDNGGFIALPNMPGWVDPKSRDHGLGPLAMVVRSILSPGRLIAMHEHQNDEIVSWVPAGVMRHDDRAGGKLVIDQGHLMVMNAGRSFWHSEETLPTDPPLDMLQILVRPHQIDLEPNIQFGPLASSPMNVWRHIFGPEGSTAPFFVRNEVDFFDIRLEPGARLDFPFIDGRDLYFYVFNGAITVGGQVFAEAEQGLLRGSGKLCLEATVSSITVAFLVNSAARITKKGTVGDNRRIPPVILFRALQLWKKLRRVRYRSAVTMA